MNNRIMLCTFAALLWTALLASAQTIPRGYEIVDITRDNGRLEQFPRINNRGQVVFQSRIFPHLTDSEIWLYDKTTNVLTQVTDDDVYDAIPDIADDGTMVWMRWIGPDVGNGPTPEIVMRTPAGVLTRITDNSDWDWSPAINNRRQIVWSRDGRPACGGWVKDIYLSDAGNSVPITTNGETDNLENQSPEINDLGEIVWTEYTFCNPPPPYNFTSRIMLYSNGQTRAPPLLGVAPQAASVNQLGWVAWKGFDPVTFLDTVEVWDGTSTRLLTDDGGVPSINSASHIAFDRWDWNSNLWRVWLYRDGHFSLITSGPVHSITPRINELDELVWSYGADLVNTDIRYMRRLNAGDLNCDGDIDAFDIEPFVLALFDREGYARAYPDCDPALADVNADGDVNAFDIEPFILILFP